MDTRECNGTKREGLRYLREVWETFRDFLTTCRNTLKRSGEIVHLDALESQKLLFQSNFRRIII